MPVILVVDELIAECHAAGMCAQQLGWTSMYAHSGCQAVQRVQQYRPDAVLTDLKMPDMDGLELVKHLRTTHPKIPVILMTAHGSEQTAVQALRAGAASYIPKKDLEQDLAEVLKVVSEAVQSARDREKIQLFLRSSESHFVLDYEPAGPRVLVSYLHERLEQMGFADQGSLLQISMALTEALANAIYHGNLQLDSSLRDLPGDTYQRICQQRIMQPPYCDRRVHVTVALTRGEARFVIRDEGPGFDPYTLPDPTLPENLTRPCGRGIMLIRTFMDKVSFNSQGNEITMIKRCPECGASGGQT